jgi:hypothetical protein
MILNTAAARHKLFMRRCVLSGHNKIQSKYRSYAVIQIPADLRRKAVNQQRKLSWVPALSQSCFDPGYRYHSCTTEYVPTAVACNSLSTYVDTVYMHVDRGCLQFLVYCSCTATVPLFERLIIFGDHITDADQLVNSRMRPYVNQEHCPLCRVCQQCTYAQAPAPQHMYRLQTLLQLWGPSTGH